MFTFPNNLQALFRRAAEDLDWIGRDPVVGQRVTYRTAAAETLVAEGASFDVVRA